MYRGRSHGFNNVQVICNMAKNFFKVECWGKLAGIGLRRTERKGIRYRQYENFSNIFYMVGMKLMKK